MLSLNKLENLLVSKNIIINKIFVIDNLCVYIEVLSTLNGNMFLLYIPSKYDIKTDDRDDVYKISIIEDINNVDNIIEEYGDEPDNLDIEKKYNEVDLDIKIEKKSNIAGILEENYNRPINLQNIIKNKKELQNINRQLRRIKFCTQNIKYKVSIRYKNYLLCVKKDDSIQCFMIKQYTGKKTYNMMIIVDLETFYNSMDTINTDINTIQEGIFKVLDKNQESNIKTFSKILQEEKNIINIIEIIYNKKKEYNIYIQKLENMLNILNTSEKNIFEQIKNTEQKYKNKDGLHSDIEKSHIISNFNNDLEKILNIKQEIIKNITDIKLRKEDLFLFTDKFLFDNNVLIDTLFKNINKMIQYVK